MPMHLNGFKIYRLFKNMYSIFPSSFENKFLASGNILSCSKKLLKMVKAK